MTKIAKFVSFVRFGTSLVYIHWRKENKKFDYNYIDRKVGEKWKWS